MKNKKSLGQHWLKNRSILENIAKLASENGIETCLEIGPGLGTLTSCLLKEFKQVIAIEYDNCLAKNLPNSFPGKNLKVINQDFLQSNLESIKNPYVATGNIPYYITSPIIEKLLTTKNKPKKIVLLVQKEVANRIAALDSHESLISLFCKNNATISLGEIITKEFFTPPPKVDSRIIILKPKTSPEIDPTFFKFIKIGFSAPRKKLLKNLIGFNNFSKEEIINIFKTLNLNLNSRPSDLKLKDWKDLALALSFSLR